MLTFVFILITITSILLFYKASGNDKQVLIFYVFWLAVIGWSSYCGFLKTPTTVPPRIVIVIIPSGVAAIYFFRRLRNQALKLKYVFAIHTLRIPVELVLYNLYLKNKIPVTMTFSGWNFDILSGISAFGLLIFLLAGKKINQKLFIIWNGAGLFLLSIIVFTAIFSAPSPLQQFAFEQPNVAILEFPYTFLPAIVVPLVTLCHLLSFKKKNLSSTQNFTA